MIKLAHLSLSWISRVLFVFAIRFDIKSCLILRPNFDCKEGTSKVPARFTDLQDRSREMQSTVAVLCTKWKDSEWVLKLTLKWL